MNQQRLLRMDEHFDRFIEDRIESEGYGSAEAVVEAGLRLLEEQEENMRKMDEAFLGDAKPWTSETLAAAIQAGLDSGEPVEFDLEDLFGEVLTEARSRQ